MRYHWNHDELEMKLLYFKKIQIDENWSNMMENHYSWKNLRFVIEGKTWIKYLKYGTLDSPIKFKSLSSVINTVQSKNSIIFPTKNQCNPVTCLDLINEPNVLSFVLPMCM